jgi:hypothetical protein
MAYLSFNKITPPAPNDPLVNEVTQLNDNWGQLDTKLQPYISGGTISNIEQGQEFFDSNFRYAVWDGAATRIPDDIDAAWSAWTAIPLVAAMSARSGFVPKWRSNSLLRQVELVGGIFYGSTPTAWPLGTAVTCTNDAVAGIPASMVPSGGEVRAQSGSVITSGASVVCAGYIIVDKPAPNTYVRIRAQFLGGSASGSDFIQFDQVSWWY